MPRPSKLRREILSLTIRTMGFSPRASKVPERCFGKGEEGQKYLCLTSTESCETGLVGKGGMRIRKRTLHARGG